MKCPCNTECTDCVAGFQKIIDLKNAGLAIYRRTNEINDVNKKTGNVDYAGNTTEDIYILHNTKDRDISPADYWPEIGNNTINCPRCRKLIERAQNLLKKGPTISGNDVTGICDHCKMKDKPCFKCRQVVKRFVPGKPDRTDINKERVKHWFTEIGYLLQDINKITNEKKRAHSDTNIDQICHERQSSARKPNVEQLFQPLELDLAAVSQTHTDSRSHGQNKEKNPVAHFPPLEKLETPIVFKDPFIRVVPSTSALFNDDETLGERMYFNVRRILKPDKKILTSKYIALPVRINSSETVSNEESVVNFEQIFKDMISGTGTQQGAKTCRNITQSDEGIGFMSSEKKHSPTIVISKKIEEKHTKRKRPKSLQPLEIKKENLLDTKTNKSKRTELLRKYHSAETLLIKIHGITEHNLKQANRIIFPKQQSNNLTIKQKSSSELIKDTKDKYYRAEEEKKLEKIFYEQTAEQSDLKEIARKMSEQATDNRESAVEDKENARQEVKHSVKSDEKDEFKAEEEVQKTRKDSQKSPKDTDIIEKKTRISDKDTQTALQIGGYKSNEEAQKVSEDAKNTVKLGYESEKGIQKGQKPKKDGYKSEKDAQKAPKEARKAEKDAYKSTEKVTKIYTKDAQVTEKDAHISEKSAKKSTKDTNIAEKDAHKFEKGTQNTSKYAQKAEKDGYASEKGAKKSTQDTKIADKYANKSERGALNTLKGAQKAEKGGYKSENGAKISTKYTHIAEKDAHKSEKGIQNTSKDAQKAGKDGYALEKGAAKSTKDAQIAEKDGYTSEKGAKNSTKDTHIAEKDANKFNKGTQNTSKDPQKAEKDGHTFEKATKKSTKHAQKGDDTFEKSAKKSTKDAQIAEKDGYASEKGAKITKDAEKDMTPKSPKSAKILQKEDQNTEINVNKIAMEATDLEFEKQLRPNIKQKTQALEKKINTELSSTELKKMKDQELKFKAEKEKLDARKQIKDEIKLDTKLGAQPISHDLFEMKSIKLKQSDDDLILKLVQMKQSTGDDVRLKNIQPINDIRLPGKGSTAPKNRIMGYPPQSETCLLWTDDSEIDEKQEPQITEVIIGPQICKIRALKLLDNSEVMPPLLKTGNDSSRIETIKSPKNEKQETIVSTETPRTKAAMKPRPLLSPGNIAAGNNTKGYVRYTLSDRKFIDNGWTLLPTEKVVRKMNVYRMRPAHPEFDWFEHNRSKRHMEYDTGEKLAEFDDNGRGRWFYRNGRMALDYYDAEELNAGQRFVIYSNGEPDERGRSRPYTLLATFDFSGNGIVFDHRGKIRLKYNQTEGVVLDRSIGPVSHWKWHTLNDPPVLQQVMIDTQIPHKDPKIMKIGGSNDNKPRKDNEEMLAIEFDNFIKEKSKKLSQVFKPFQIKMKALKINEHFSLRVLDQATVYLLYRDGTTNLKLNIGMVLDQKEIVDTDTAEVGEVSSSLEKLPARTESLACLQRSVAHAQHYDWKRTERDRKMHPAEPSASVDKLVAGISRPLGPPPRPVLSQSNSLTTTEHCKCSRKPSSTSVYYDTRFY